MCINIRGSVVLNLNQNYASAVDYYLVDDDKEALELDDLLVLVDFVEIWFVFPI